MSVDSLRDEVRQLAQMAENHAFGWMQAHMPSAEDLLVEIQEMVGVYADTAALLTADWYDELYPDSSYSAVMDDDLADEKIVNVANWVHAGPQLPENRMRVAANRIVFDAARRTVLVNAQSEGVALARDEEAKCCNTCIASATLGPKERRGRSDDVEQFFHPSCEGLFVPVRQGVWEPPSHAYEWRERVKAARLAGNTDTERIASWLDSH